MKKKNAIILMTAVGILGASAGAGASGMITKVEGLLRKDVGISVNGHDTKLEPVYIKGQAYFPVRGAAAEMGYTLTYNVKDKEIELTSNQQGEEEEAQAIRMTGVVQSVEKMADGRTKIELLGRGDYKWIILYADKDSVVTDLEGKAFDVAGIKAGTEISTEFGPIVAMSYPGQSHANKITVVADRLVKEDVIQSVKKTDDGWQVQFGTTKDGVVTPSLTLTAGKETTLMTSEGQPVNWEDLKAGTKVRAFYGADATNATPAQGPLFYLVVADASTQAPAKMTPEQAKEYRDLVWSKLSDDQKSHVTKADEAAVSFVDANDGAIIAAPDAQAKLDALKAAKAHLVSVTYSNDQEALIGPLTVVLDPESKTIVGYFARR